MGLPSEQPRHGRKGAFLRQYAGPFLEPTRDNDAVAGWEHGIAREDVGLREAMLANLA